MTGSGQSRNDPALETSIPSGGGAFLGHEVETRRGDTERSLISVIDDDEPV